MKEKMKRYLAAKAEEEQANERRLAIEAEIVGELAANVPDEGTNTFTVDGFKVSFTQRITRKLDDKAFALIADAIPPKVCPVEKVEAYKIDDAGCRWLKANEPGLWTVLSKALTEKPQKVGVKIQEVEQ